MGTTTANTPSPAGLPAAVFTRVLEEGYGPGAWYGSDMRAALDGVTAETAFTRPARGRHNIAEVALHHAYWSGQIASKLTGAAPLAFPLDGEDWFAVNDENTLSWSEIAATLERSQQRLSQAVSEVASGARTSPLGEADRFGLVIGITGHAAYHAGQIQLLKKLVG